ncbi:pentatricopeptide repeat-containing protein At5g15340, mitochondrial-like [Hibiscus syriacus]|uniref:pentatricopeptide repeat-containing protein At5g15340, mitochondrial-like n=1 Tax=Hibiscus syriacus TaxID=106335 RepID=UPI001924B390|nr:pentatricopeptide repeat-containing protein At5g15340, mitochondrial-like [Hibiscus syriacus]
MLYSLKCLKTVPKLMMWRWFACPVHVPRCGESGPWACGEDGFKGRVLVDMYATSEMKEKSVVSWTVVLDGVLKWEDVACAQSRDVVMGRWVHAYGLKTIEMEMDIMVETAMPDMFAKCGRVDTEIKVFKCMPRRSWNAMISGLAMHGRGGAVVEMFQQLIKEVRADDLTLLAVLRACSHSGMIGQGSYYFDSHNVYALAGKQDKANALRKA